MKMYESENFFWDFIYSSSTVKSFFRVVGGGWRVRSQSQQSLSEGRATPRSVCPSITGQCIEKTRAVHTP